jgi:hypothetical protein
MSGRVFVVRSSNVANPVLDFGLLYRLKALIKNFNVLSLRKVVITLIGYDVYVWIYV